MPTSPRRSFSGNSHLLSQLPQCLLALGTEAEWWEMRALAGKGTLASRVGAFLALPQVPSATRERLSCVGSLFFSPFFCFCFCF